MRSSNNVSRLVSCDFFKVKIGGTSPQNFTDVINGIITQHPQVLSRNVETGDGYTRLHGWQTTGSRSQGAILRLRMDHSASVARLDQDDLADLQLRPGEVLTEYFCFQYYDEYKTLVVHRNRDAGYMNRMTHYLEALAPKAMPMQFLNIFTKDAWDRFAQMRDIKIAEVTIARPTSLVEFDNGNKSALEMTNLAIDSNAETLTVRLSVGHTRNRLTEAARLFFATLADRDLGIAQSATVHGTMSYIDPGTGAYKDEVTVIDLVEEKMREKILVTAAGQMDVSDYQSALEQAYLRRRDDIRRQFNDSPWVP